MEARRGRSIASQSCLDDRASESIRAGMAPVGRLLRRVSLRGLSGLLLTYLLATLVIRHSKLQLMTKRVPPPMCQRDMSVVHLPPMADDNTALTRGLFVYLTSSHAGACGRIGRFGGTPKMRHDKIPAMDGQKNVCMDKEFEALFGSQCLVVTVYTDLDPIFDRDVTAFDCEVAHATPPNAVGQSEVDGSPVNSSRDLTSTLVRRGYENRTIELLSVSVDGEEFALLRQEVKRGRSSVLFSNVRQLVVRLNFGRHTPVQQHGSFYRELYTTLLEMQALGFYPFSSEPNYLADADMVVPGLADRLHLSIDVAWLRSGCVQT